MKATDLRRYNYLDYYGQSVVVLEILRNDYIVFGYFLDSTLSHFTGSATEKRKLTEKHSPKPIPLNEEWLLKFGFVRDKLEVRTFYKGDFEIYLPIFLQYKDLVLNKCKHVHQLQNIYHALTGKELTIKELVK